MADNPNRTTTSSESFNRRTLKICLSVYLLRPGHRPLGMASTLGVPFYFMRNA